jgi:hypothetical protein
METSVWNLIRAFMGSEHGRNCRRCDESIERRDDFGMSEGVCRPCRHGYDT